jgi:YycE-like C-terminal domain
VDALAARLAAMGYPADEPENPYWTTAETSATVEDPDGWRVVLVEPANTGTPV